MRGRTAKVTRWRENRKGEGASAAAFLRGGGQLPGSKTRMPGKSGAPRRSARAEVLLLQLSLEDLDFLGQCHVAAHQALDLAYSVQHGGVVAAAEAPADLR